MQEEELNGLAALLELKRVRQDVEQLKSVEKLLRRSTEDVLDGTVREVSCLMNFLHRLMNIRIPSTLACK